MTKILSGYIPLAEYLIVVYAELKESFTRIRDNITDGLSAY